MHKYVSRNPDRCYWKVAAPGHPFGSGGYVLGHRLVVEKAIGRPLDPKHPIHHVNGDGLDNRPCNLVVCEDNSYHKLLHIRAAALAACGNPNFRTCVYCKKYDDPKNMWSDPGRRSSQPRHLACQKTYRRGRYLHRVANEPGFVERNRERVSEYYRNKRLAKKANTENK